MIKKIRVVSACFFAIGLIVMLASAVTCQAAWEGVDKNVVEKFAEQAGRPARKPLIHTDQGDLLLFLFLLAGITGGFIGGYLCRGLFAPKELQLKMRPGRRPSPPYGRGQPPAGPSPCSFTGEGGATPPDVAPKLPRSEVSHDV